MKAIIRGPVLCFIVLYLIDQIHGHLSQSTQFVIELELPNDDQIAKDVALRYQLQYVRKVLSDVYILRRNEEDLEENVHRRKRSAEFLEKDLLSDPHVKWAKHEDYLIRVKRSIDTEFNDPYFNQQWYLSNKGQHGLTEGSDLNVMSAWNIGITGKGVVVTIVDDGLQHSHDDLQQNYDPYASADLNDADDIYDDPTPDINSHVDNSHGTKCAGQVGAMANNGVCGVGVAYNAGLGGVRLLDGDHTDSMEAAALSHNRSHVDIYSCCWGPLDRGDVFDGPGPVLSRALKEGVEQGRNSKGNIFVWAAGNGGLVNDDCSADGYVASIYTLSIGSVSWDGGPTFFMESCPSTMAVVYSGSGQYFSHFTDIKYPMVTTTLNNDCETRFKGTSSAAPLAAGIVALILEANPNLTWRDVQYIIVESSTIPNSTTTTSTSDKWSRNGAGFNVHPSLGFGLMDAGRMVETAITWTNVSPQHKCTVPYSTHSLPISLRSGETVTLELDVSECSIGSEPVTSIEHIQSVISFQYSRRGDISIILTSPHGSQSELLSERPKDTDSGGVSEWGFMTVHHWGEYPGQYWTLQIRAANSSIIQEGRIELWTLIFYGTENPASRNLKSEEPSSSRRDYTLQELNKFEQNIKNIQLPTQPNSPPDKKEIKTSRLTDGKREESISNHNKDSMSVGRSLNPYITSKDAETLRQVLREILDDLQLNKSKRL